jgi:predicted nucleotidyltransferase
MDFQLDIGELTNTINEYENFIRILAEQKENINKTIAELTEAGWSGEAKDKFLENHIRKQEFYTKLEEDIKYEKNALENEEKPRAIRLKKQSEDFENCIKRSAGGGALTNDDTGLISLQYGGQFPINNNVSECTDNYYKQMNSKFVEILNLANSLSFTTFLIGGDKEKFLWRI